MNKRRIQYIYIYIYIYINLCSICFLVTELHGKGASFKKHTADIQDSTLEVYIQAARLALENDNPTVACTATEHYFQLASEKDSVRAEMATILKWALLTSGQLNEKFLAYHNIPEMGLMLPFGFPAIEIAKPYSCLTMACGLYVPALSTMICATDQNGIDLFSARLLTQICIKTGRLSLARRYISYLPKNEQTIWYKQLTTEKQALWVWDSLPYCLPHEPYSTDNWVQLFYPTNAAEKAAWNLNNTQATCLLDYFTLLQLLYKRLDLLTFIIESYRDLEAKRLPSYVQEAFLLSRNYLVSNVSREEILQWHCGNLRIEPDIIAKFEHWFNDFQLMQYGAMSLVDMQKIYGDTYMFYFIWDGITY